MKGICFIEPLFHATIEGRKTQTRRIMNPQPTNSQIWNSVLGIEMKPRYKKGEILYLKEPYIDDLNMDRTYYKYSDEDVKEVSEWLKMPPDKVKSAKKIWKNKLFMPESSARYFIKIKDVGSERLQDISEEDCLKEGIQKFEKFGRHPKFGLRGWEWSEMYTLSIASYAKLMNQINGNGTWESNPFVFVYDYELI